MQEPTTISHSSSEQAPELGARRGARRAWFGEPFLHPGEDAVVALAPGTARRRALDDAIDEIDAGRRVPVAALEGALRPDARPRARARGGVARDRRRHRAAPPPDRRARGDADRADRGDPARRRRERQRRRTGASPSSSTSRRTRRTTTSSSSTRSPRRRTFVGEDPGASRRYRFRHPTASGKTIAAAGFVESARELGVLILTHRRLLVDQFRRDLTTEGYGDRLTDAIETGKEPLRDDPITIQTYAWFARHGDELSRERLPARDLRRGPHRPRREDVGRDPPLLRAALHRHDRDRAADREAGLRRLPRLGRRPPARRRRAARADRAAALPPRAAGRGDQLGADRRRRLRGARARRSARPLGAQPGGREPLPRPLRRDARDRLRGRRRARLQPRAGVPGRRPQGRGRLRADTAARARRDARGLRARRDQRAHQRAAARRGLELAARDGLHAPRADGLAARLPAAHRPDHADAPAQGGRHRRRLRPEGLDAHRPRHLAPLAARLRLLPRGRPRHAGAAAPLGSGAPAGACRRRRGSCR